MIIHNIIALPLHLSFCVKPPSGPRSLAYNPLRMLCWFMHSCSDAPHNLIPGATAPELPASLPLSSLLQDPLPYNPAENTVLAQTFSISHRFAATPGNLYRLD